MIPQSIKIHTPFSWHVVDGILKKIFKSLIYWIFNKSPTIIIPIYVSGERIFITRITFLDITNLLMFTMIILRSLVSKVLQVVKHSKTSSLSGEHEGVSSYTLQTS